MRYREKEHSIKVSVIREGIALMKLMNQDTWWAC